MPSEVDYSPGLPPSGVVSQSEAELAAVLAWAAMCIVLEWTPPPFPEQLDDWFFGSAHDAQPWSFPVPFFPEEYEEITKLWKAPFSTRSLCWPSISLP